MQGRTVRYVGGLKEWILPFFYGRIQASRVRILFPNHLNRSMKESIKNLRESHLLISKMSSRSP